MSQVLAEMQNHGNNTQEIYQEVENRNIAMWGGR